MKKIRRSCVVWVLLITLVVAPLSGVRLTAYAAEEGFPLGYRDVPEDTPVESVSIHGDGYVPALRGSGTVPEKYGAAEFSSYMPELRDQGPFGSCWAHAALALAEISLRKKGSLTEPDLSELQLAYFS